MLPDRLPPNSQREDKREYGQMCRRLRWLPSRLIPHRYRPRAELPACSRASGQHASIASANSARPVARQPGMHHELVLIDQSQGSPRSRQRKSTPPTNSPSPAPASRLSLLDRLSQISGAPVPRSNQPAPSVFDTTHFFAASIVRAKGVPSTRPSIRAAAHLPATATRPASFRG